MVIPALQEEGNIGSVVQGCRRVCEALAVSHEVLVVDGGSRDDTVRRAEEAGARVIHQTTPGYGGALREAFAQCRGRYVATLDSDLSHPPDVLKLLYRNRSRADLLIASRFVRGGLAIMPRHRRLLSVILNGVFSRVLDVPVADLSSGFRLYRRDMLKRLEASHDDFSFLQEMLVAAYAGGYSVHEVPFHYFPRVHGSSKAHILKFGLSYLKLLWRSSRLRRSTHSADYDERAYFSWVLPVRWRERRRYRIVTRWADRVGRVADLGCGSSRILEALPGAVGLDIAMNKLRYRRPLGNPLVRGSVERLPLRSGYFDQVICSQVIGYVPDDERIFAEFERVLRPGGTLVLATPDHDRWQWTVAERLSRLLPGSSARQRITHHGFDALRRRLSEHGFDIVDHGYVFPGELMLKARKGAESAAGRAAGDAADAASPRSTGRS